ncbi:ROK family protein [Mesorhizobium sp.]|uniref:ROK family protein n=1 Tax=Mesorhizobium sp. TaxID=1871066 RepID=UPI0025B95A06|nr:ROK family protein [Mesorhizobium sp.]
MTHLRLGVGIANLMHLYSPDVVVVGGGLANSFDALMPGIRNRLNLAVMPPFREIPVVAASLSENSGLIGAAIMVFDDLDRNALAVAAKTNGGHSAAPGTGSGVRAT